MGCLGSKEKKNDNATAPPAKIPSYSVRLLGDLAVGKSSLLLSWADGTFSGEAIATVGSEEHRAKNINVDTSQITLDVFDSAGQERYNVVTGSQYRRVAAFMYCFDLTKAESFKNIGKWVEQVETYSDNQQAPAVLVGNKSDLPNRVVTTEDAQAYAKKMKMKYIETSAKTSTNVDLVFTTVAKAIVEQEEANNQEDSD